MIEKQIALFKDLTEDAKLSRIRELISQREAIEAELQPLLKPAKKAKLKLQKK